MTDPITIIIAGLIILNVVQASLIWAQQRRIEAAERRVRIG